MRAAAFVNGVTWRPPRPVVDDIPDGEANYGRRGVVSGGIRALLYHD
jgi:hypothetical protein